MAAGMRKLLGVAFRPTPRATSNGRSGFAVLPQQTEDELALSEAHSKLDMALNFLQRDVGYALLDDVRLRPGGAASVRDGRAKPAGQLPQFDKGAKSAKVPKGEPRDIDDEPEDTDPGTAISIGPEVAKYAHYEEDLMLVTRFCTMLAEAAPSAPSKVKHDQLYKTVLQGIRLMHLCDYEYSDVVMVLAHASVYFRNTFASIGYKMSEHEAAHVCVLLIYLAHSFLLDETCPLRCWQKHIFRKYCTLKVLDAALFRLFKMRGFLLRISKDEERMALRGLFGVPNGSPATSMLSNGIVLKDRYGNPLLDPGEADPAA